MPTFEYRALDQNGKPVSGALSADGRGAALSMLSSQGLHPLSVDERREGPAGQPPSRLRSGRVSQATVQAFTRQLANLLSAGVNLSRALHVLCREATHPAARARWEAIHDDVVGGMPLADALARWPSSFPDVYVAMVRAGETGGFLDKVLEQIADFREREQELKGKVKAALVYPSVLAVLASLVLIFLLTFFIPRFSTMFTEFGGRLPWLTRMIVKASGIVTHYGIGIAIGIFILVLALRRVLDSAEGRRAFERLVLGLPAVGSVVARFALVRFCRMLGTLLAAGVPMVAALRTAKEAIGNQTLSDTVSSAVEDVQHGAPLAASLGVSNRLFPPAVIEMVAVAEESSRLDKELTRVALAYEGDLDRRLRMLVALVEPALLFVMAGIVGTVVIGMLLPVFTLQELIR